LSERLHTRIITYLQNIFQCIDTDIDTGGWATTSGQDKVKLLKFPKLTFGRWPNFPDKMENQVS